MTAMLLFSFVWSGVAADHDFYFFQILRFGKNIFINILKNPELLQTNYYYT